MEENKRTAVKMILYKLDRTLAIIGIVLISCTAIFSEKLDAQSVSVVMAGVAALGTYIGVKGGKQNQNGE